MKQQFAAESDGARQADDGPAVRVILADDHDLVRAGIAALLEELPNVGVIATAQDGAELLALVERLDADLVITDIAMPMVDGLEAIERVHGMRPEVRILVLSMDESGHVARRAMASGANGYLVKSAAPAELGAAVRTLMAGGCYFSPRIAKALSSSGSGGPQELLTERQLEILTLIARGKSTKEIGFQLGLSSKTVDVHRGRIMERLEIRDIAGLTRYALRHGLVR